MPKERLITRLRIKNLLGSLAKSEFTQLIVYARLFRRHYGNWSTVLLKLATGRDSVAIVLWMQGRAHCITLSKHSVTALAKLLEAGWKPRDYDGFFITLEGEGGVLMKCRTNGLDFASLLDIFVDRVYETEIAGKIIVDIGVSDGDSAVFFATHGALRVIGLEADSESFDLATSNVALNRLADKISLLNFALSSEEGLTWKPKTDNMVVWKNSTAKNSHLVKVHTITLESLMKRFLLGHIDLLKLDCEGCERSVVASFSNEASLKIEHIIMEYHFSLDEVSGLLQDKGFSIDRVEKRIVLASRKKLDFVPQSSMSIA